MSYDAPPENAYQAKPNSTMALVSLIAGILGFTFLPTIGSIVALITGYMAKKEIKESAGALSGEGMATAGLILGWIGVGLTVVGGCIACFVLVLIPLGIFGSLFGLSRETLLPILFSVL
jgi:hypothetical protein